MAVISLKRIKEIKNSSEEKFVELLGIEFPVIKDGYEIEKRKAKLDYKKHFKAIHQKDIPFRKLNKELQEFHQKTSNVPINQQETFRIVTFDSTNQIEFAKYKLIRDLAEELCAINFDFEFYDDEDIEQKNILKFGDVIKSEWNVDINDLVAMALFLYTAVGGSPLLTWELMCSIKAVREGKEKAKYIAENFIVFQLNNLLDDDSREKFYEGLVGQRMKEIKDE